MRGKPRLSEWCGQPREAWQHGAKRRGLQGLSGFDQGRDQVIKGDVDWTNRDLALVKFIMKNGGFAPQISPFGLVPGES